MFWSGALKLVHTVTRLQAMRCCHDGLFFFGLVSVENTIEMTPSSFPCSGCHFNLWLPAISFLSWFISLRMHTRSHGVQQTKTKPLNF